jgi:hypothetical protein
LPAGRASPGSNFSLGSGVEKIFVAGISRFSFQPVSVTLLLKMQTTTNVLKPTAPDAGIGNFFS